MTHRHPQRAVQYIRMSTDVQDLSPEIQKSAIAAYAREHQIEVVDTYFDGGKSGLTLRNRPAMQKLLHDVADQQRVFSLVLVYDISRWGRFQDVDASAYHEYHCRLNGVDVRYVQEPFADQSSPMGALMKSLKRVMAAEYSRELSMKSRAGQLTAIQRGFQVGTLPCIGISRIAVLRSGEAQRPLQPDEHKAPHREHIRWIPGPPEEVALVRRIFDLYAHTDITGDGLMDLLRREGRTTAAGRPISRHMLYSVLSCEAFKGTFIWGRRDNGIGRSEGHPSLVRKEGAVEAIVSAEVWDKAHNKRARRRGRRITKDQLLADLRQAVDRQPDLTGKHLRMLGYATRNTYVKHFGSLAAALALVGHAPYRLTETLMAQIHRKCASSRRLVSQVQAFLTAQAISCGRVHARGVTLVVGGADRLRVQPIWPCQDEPLQWQLPKIYRHRFDYVLVVRMVRGEELLDSLLLNRHDYFKHPVSFGTELAPGFRFTSDPREIVRALQFPR